MRCFICAQIVIAPPGLFVRLGMGIRKARAWLPARRAFFCAVSFFRGEDSLGREFRDVGLLAQKAIAFRFRNDDDADAWNAFD